MRVSASLLVATVVVATVSAQTPQAPVFRGGVSLVAVDVTVLDKEKPVPGLTADDFEVKLDGHVQAVRTASYEHSEVTSLAKPVPIAPTATSVAATNTVAGPDPRTVVILLDDLSIPATRGKDLLLAGRQFVARLPPTDLVGFTTTSGVGPINPTRNRASIEQALKRATGQYLSPPEMRYTGNQPSDLVLGLDEAIEIDAGNDGQFKVAFARDCAQGVTTVAALQATYLAPGNACGDDLARKIRTWAALVHLQVERQISAYTAVLKAMQAGPGRKVLVLLSDGLLTAERGKDGAEALQEIGRAAAASGVELSVLYAAPDDISMTSRSPEEQAVKRTDGLAQMTGVQTVADLTGGTFWRVMGQPDRFFDFVGQATSGVYHLGVEMPPGDGKHNFTLAVHVKRGDVSVHANRVAVPPTAVAEPAPDVQVKQALTAGLPHYGVPLSVSALVRRGASASDLIISTNVDVPGNPPGPLTVTFGLVDEGGQMKSGRTTVAKPTLGDEYRVSTSLPVKPGTYALRLAVEDASGHVGSLETRIAAQLTKAGPLTMSDMVTAWSAADGKPQFLALGDLPAAATSLGGLLELYSEAATPPTNVQVKWDLVNDAQQTVASVVSAPASSKDRLVAHAEFPAPSIAPGLYELKATVLVGGQAVGTTSAPIQKVGHSTCEIEDATCVGPRVVLPAQGRRR